MFTSSIGSFNMLSKGKLMQTNCLYNLISELYYHSNYFSPIKSQLEKGINVLDSGCGPATWVFEMGETYPCSRFYGVDASCVFPETIKPANVEFVISNITKEIPYDKNFFDFVHQRLLVLALTDEDWTNVG